MAADVPKLQETLTSSNTESETVKWRGGEGVFGFSGTFGGATGSLQLSFDAGSTWLELGSDYAIDGSAGTATAFGFGPLPPCYLRLSLSSASGTTDLTGFIQ